MRNTNQFFPLVTASYICSIGYTGYADAQLHQLAMLVGEMGRRNPGFPAYLATSIIPRTSIDSMRSAALCHGAKRRYHIKTAFLCQY
jgi:hypothetical protein